jgi:hypothetical protein
MGFRSVYSPKVLMPWMLCASLTKVRSESRDQVKHMNIDDRDKISREAPIYIGVSHTSTLGVKTLHWLLPTGLISPVIYSTERSSQLVSLSGREGLFSEILRI